MGLYTNGSQPVLGGLPEAAKAKLRPKGLVAE